MGNVDPLSRVLIAARRSRARHSGKPTRPASQKQKNIKSLCMKAPKTYVATRNCSLSSCFANEHVRTGFATCQWTPHRFHAKNDECLW